MRQSVRGFAALLLLVLVPAAGRAQTDAARKITVDSVLRALESGMTRIRFDTIDFALDTAFKGLARRIRDDGTAKLTIDSFVAATAGGKDKVRLLDVFRWDRQHARRTADSSNVRDLLLLQDIAIGVPFGFQSRLLEKVPSAEARQYTAAMQQLDSVAKQRTNDAATAKLKRYEIKFGPTAPRLNPIETLLNYGAARTGLFAPGPGGPSPWELVASYSTTDLGVAGNSEVLPLRVVSGVHFGLRHYQFGAPLSLSPLARLKRPTSWSLTASSFAADDHALRLPFESGQRWGGVLSIGDLRAALATGRDWRALIGMSAQIIPHVF